MRRFEFEAEMYETLACLPMTVKKNLDRVALKISHKQWLALELSERRLIRELPAETDSQLRKLSDLIHRLVLDRCHEKLAILSAEQQQAALPPLELPAHLAANARGVGIELGRDQWVMLDEDERYVLMKLGGGNHVKRNFEPALKEFLKMEKDGSRSSSQNIHQD